MIFVTMISKEYVKELFSYLETDATQFFNKVSDQVDWTVKGTHPLAGHYISKQDFIDHTMKRLNKILRGGIRLTLNHVFVDGDSAIVEKQSISNDLHGKPFNNVYCWVCKFDSQGVIIQVRAYLDSARVQSLIDENETV